MKMKICSMILALAMLFSLAACGDSSDKDTTASASGSSQTTTSAGSITSVQRESINVGIEADLTDFNPWTYTGVGANAAIWGLYQPLLHLEDGVYYPGVMKSYEFSDDGLVISCEIFDYIYDWEGNHITADDILFCWEKALEAFPENKDRASEFIKTGEYTFDMMLNRQLYIGELNDITSMRIVSQAAFENSEDDMHTTPVGTGPYKLTQRTSGYSFTYEKVENWWQTDESMIHSRDMSNVNTINWFVITESVQRTIALEQGTIDICASISADDLEKFDDKNGYRLNSVPDNLSMNLFSNCDDSSPMSDLNLRLAVCYAISNQAILDSVYSGKGTVLYEASPSWAVGYNDAWEKEDNYYQYDQAKAEEYLAQSDYAGEKLTIICTTDEASVNSAQMVQNFLLQIGIQTEIASYESSVFTQYIKQADMWDIMMYSRPTSVYYINAVYSNLSETRHDWGGTIGFAYDDELQELIQLCYYEETSTAENLELLHEHLIASCYGMGIVNKSLYSVVPDWISDVTLSYRKTIIPGGCTYTEAQ